MVIWMQDIKKTTTYDLVYVDEWKFIFAQVFFLSSSSEEVMQFNKSFVF